jgi:hypothetical protein
MTNSSIFSSPGFMVSTSILLLNDFILKQYFPGMITGKLSDFAGLFMFPLYINAVFPKNKLLIYWLVGLFFVWWKSILSQPVIDLWNLYNFYCIGRTVDYSDYIALLILPLSYNYKPSIQIDSKIVNAAMFFVALFGILATAGTTGKIKEYPFKQSKYKVHATIQELYKENPTLIVSKEKRPKLPKSVKLEDEIAKTSENGDGLYGEPASSYFILATDPDTITCHAAFVGSTLDWQSPPCKFDLVGIGQKKESLKDVNTEDYLKAGAYIWRYNNDLNNEEKEKYIKLFEEKVIKPLYSKLN